MADEKPRPRDYPKMVRPHAGGPDRVVWTPYEEIEVTTGKAPDQPPTFEVPVRQD